MSRDLGILETSPVIRKRDLVDGPFRHKPTESETTSLNIEIDIFHLKMNEPQSLSLRLDCGALNSRDCYISSIRWDLRENDGHEQYPREHYDYLPPGPKMPHSSRIPEAAHCSTL